MLNHFPSNKGFPSVGRSIPCKRFRGVSLRLLKDRFEKDRYITQTEAEFLAQMLNVYPEKIINWFQHQRMKGTIAYIISNRDKSNHILL